MNNVAPEPGGIEIPGDAIRRSNNLLTGPTVKRREQGPSVI